MLEVCICTHNPRIHILKLVVESLARQTVGPDAFRVVLIDNASTPPISEQVLAPLRAAGIIARIVREERLGLVHARLRVAGEADGKWILFVDDDNELSQNYIEEGFKFVSSRDNIGCFGGKLLLPQHLTPPVWVTPFLPYLGIKDVGEDVIVSQSPDWGDWEPPGAGVFVCRSLLDDYRARLVENPQSFRLGRQGAKNLTSCDDSLLTRGAFRLGLANAYNPRLVLYHHLSESRFKFSYLMRLMYNYGVSHVVLEALLKGPQPIPKHYGNFGAFVTLLCRVLGSALKNARPFALGMMAYHLGARAEHLKRKNGSA